MENVPATVMFLTSVQSEAAKRKLLTLKKQYKFFLNIRFFSAVF